MGRTMSYLDQRVDAAIQRARTLAEGAALRHAQACAAAAATVLRREMPAAVCVDVDTREWYDNVGGVAILGIFDGAGRPIQPPEEAGWNRTRAAIEELFLNALDFATPGLCGWERQRPECETDDDRDLYRVTLPMPVSASCPSDHLMSLSTVWVLRHEDKHGDDISFFCTRQAALAALCQVVDARWDNITDRPGVPPTSDGLTPEKAVEMYFLHSEGLESHAIYADTISGATDASVSSVESGEAS